MANRQLVELAEQKAQLEEAITELRKLRDDTVDQLS
jgi:hypothetical protein